ncbi:MAG: hypothetical protein F4Y00_09130 [Bacteroidetes bacterium SB0662_bin_6]|nr:hypothetical protein [Bacteroidetes bacterium SB0662_bin_6]
MIGLCTILPVYAQDTEEPAPVLPDLTPQVVEIRTGLDISLPSLQRQPLIGFNPPPRVASVPADRRPYAEVYKQESADLPDSPLAALDPDPIASLSSGAPGRGMAEAAAGRYLGRLIRLRTELPLSRNAAFHARVDYAGSEGHSPADIPENISASFNTFEALVGLQQKTGPVSFGLDLDGLVHARRMYGAVPGARHISGLRTTPLRTGQGGGGAIWIKTNAAARVDFHARARYGAHSWETNANLRESETDSDTFTRNESVWVLESELALPVTSGSELAGDVRYTQLGFDTEEINSVSMLDIGAGTRIRSGPRLQAMGGIRFLTFTESDSTSSTWIAPDIHLDFRLLPGLQFYARNDARAEHRSTASMYRENPFLVDRPIVQPTVYTLDMRIGGRMQVNVVGIDVYGGYANAPNFRYFEAARIGESRGYAQGMIAARYAEATIAYAGGDLSVHLPAGLSIAAGITFRNGKLKEDDTDIPYFGPVTGRGGLSWSFRNGRGFLQTTLDYEGARHITAGGIQKLDGYFDVDASALYPITQRIGVLLRLDNIVAGSAARWEHYDRTPFAISLGARTQW